MKKQKVERKQDPHFIRTYWWDLKQTAADLRVPVSIVVQAMEITETNRRDVVIDHIKTWTPVTTSHGAAINLPLITKNEPKSFEQIKREGKYNALDKLYRKTIGEPHTWGVESKLSVLYAAVEAGIRIDLKNDGWLVPVDKQKEILEERNAPSMLSHGLQQRRKPFEQAFIGKDLNEEPVENYLNRPEEFGKAVSECDYIRKTEILTEEEILDKYGDNIIKEAKIGNQTIYKDGKFQYGQFFEAGYLQAELKGMAKEGITSVEQPNAEEIFGGYIKTELLDVNNLKAPLTPDQCYKRFVYEVTEIKQGFWSKFRRARHFRLEILAKGDLIEVIPQWIHANMGMQGYDKCKVEEIGKSIR